MLVAQTVFPLLLLGRKVFHSAGRHAIRQGCGKYLSTAPLNRVPAGNSLTRTPQGTALASGNNVIDTHNRPETSATTYSPA